MASSDTGTLTVAIFGAMSVLAQELRRSLAAGPLTLERLSLYEKEGRVGSLTEVEGEAMVIAAPDADIVGATTISFICGEDDPRSAQYLDWILAGSGRGIDMVGASRHRPGIPVINTDVNPGDLDPEARLVAVPHPVAHPLSTVLHVLEEDFGVEDACATAFRPVSDHGKPGVEELHHQTISVLNFADVPREIFGRQLAFNLAPLPLRGEEGMALEKLAREDVGRVMGAPDFPLSLRIIQAPVFYAHAYMMRVRLEGEPSEGDLRQSLERPGVIRLGDGQPERTPAELGDEKGITVTGLWPDPSPGGGWWVWMVADGIRHGAAANAARLAARMTGLEVG